MLQFFLMNNDDLDGKITFNQKVYNEYMPNSALIKTLSEETNETVTISKDDQAQIKLAGTVASLQALNSANIAIMKTTFPTQDFKEDWFNSTKRNYNIIKEYSIDWCTSIAPAITSSIPSSIIEFNPKFQFFSKEVIAVIDSSSAKDEKKNLIIKNFDELLQNSERISNNFNEYSCIKDGKSVGTIPNWSNNILNACNDFNDNSDDIKNNRYKDIGEDIEKNNQINAAIEVEIKKYNNLIITGGVFVAGGATIGAIGYPLVFMNPVVGIATIGVGIGVAITGASLLGVYIERLKKKYKEKAEIDSKINYDRQLLSALQNLEHATKVFNNSYNVMMTNTTSFISSWNNISNNLNSVIQNLKDGKEYNQNDYLSAVKMELEASMPLWDSVYNYSLQLRNSAILEEKIIDQNTVL